jgi:hypothetical protein
MRRSEFATYQPIQPIWSGQNGIKMGAFVNIRKRDAQG